MVATEWIASRGGCVNSPVAATTANIANPVSGARHRHPTMIPAINTRTNTMAVDISKEAEGPAARDAITARMTDPVAPFDRFLKCLHAATDACPSSAAKMNRTLGARASRPPVIFQPRLYGYGASGPT